MAAVSSSSSALVPRRPKPASPPSLLSFFRPICSTSPSPSTAVAVPLCRQTPLFTSLFTSRSPFYSCQRSLFSATTSSYCLMLPRTAPTKASTESPSLLLDDEEEEEEEEEVFVGLKEEDEYSDDGDDEEEEIEELDDNFDGQIENLKLEESVVTEIGGVKSKVKLPNLTVKEKKELASYAHGLGKKLKCQMVGKSGVTDNVVISFIETLEANELLKIKIHRTCPGEIEDVVRYLEETTGSVVVGQIGRTVIIYRPSITKMKAEEKRMEARRVYVRKNCKLKPTFSTRGPGVRLSGRGRRGISRT